MRDKETSSRVETEQVPVEMIVDLMLTAEKELAAFYEAIEKRYGSKEARKAAYDWIAEMATMDWPIDGALPNWRRVSIVAADCLASRVIEYSPHL
jgi:hypothetical protein